MNDHHREATWLVTPEAELARARREGTALTPAFFVRAPVRTAVAVGGVGLFFWMAWIALQPSAWPAIVFGLAMLCLGLLPLVRRWEEIQDEARVTERAIESEFTPNVGRLVTILIRQGDAPTGEDVGMLWFEDGRLYFSGYRTSFGLVPSQVRGHAKLRDAVAGVRGDVELTLARDTAAGPLRLSIQQWLPPHAHPTLKNAQLQVELDEWKAKDVVGEGQWPPTALGPRVASVNRLLAGALAWTIFPSGVLWVLLLWLAPELAGVGFFGTAFVFVSCVPACNLRWRAIRDRRRLRGAW